MILGSIFIIITLMYLFVIGRFIYGFDKVADFKIEDIPAKTKFSIVIPFRNESKNLSALLTSISQLNYPNTNYQFLFINDDSEDTSVEIIQAFVKKSSLDISILNNLRTSNSPKKDAITTAINQAKHEWIITTDADCVVPKYWLDTFDCFIQKNQYCQLLVAPVSYHKTLLLLDKFQALDFMSLMGTTIGAFGIKNPFLCNGANLGYTKTYFKNLNGFDGNNTIASGDDVFLLQKAIKKNKESVCYLKSEQAIVHTTPEQTFKALVSQRVRWASKTGNYTTAYGKFVGISVLLMNAMLIICVVLAMSGIIKPSVLAYLFVIKSGVDFLLLFKTARFLNQETALSSFLISAIFYPFFSVYIAFISAFKGYKWKGRYFDK